MLDKPIQSRAASQGAFAGSDIASDERQIAGCSANNRSEPGKAGASGSTPLRSTTNPQHAAHVIDYGCWAALKHLRDIGAACGRKTRKLSDDEFDYNQFSIENGDGEIY